MATKKDKPATKTAKASKPAAKKGAAKDKWVATDGSSSDFSFKASNVVRGRGAYTSASIFLPAAGYGSGTSLGLVPHISGPYGLYWSSVPNSDNNNYAWELFFYSDYNEMESAPRYSGQSIRPVQ